MLSPTLFGFYIDELENFLAETDGDSILLLDVLIKILLYVDDMDLLSQSVASLQRLLDHLQSFLCQIIATYKSS